MFLKGISYAAKQSFIIFFRKKKNDASKTWKNKDVLCGRMFYFCSLFLHIMTVLTIKSQVYLMYILGNIKNQILNFFFYFQFIFFQGMLFPDDVKDQFLHVKVKSFKCRM